MTDHKPLTDEELAELDEPNAEYLGAETVLLTAELMRRLLSELRSLRAEKARLQVGERFFIQSEPRGFVTNEDDGA